MTIWDLMPSSGGWAQSAVATSMNGRAAPSWSCRPWPARSVNSCAKLVDANSGFSPRRAIEVGRLLEAEGISHYEEPCPYWKLSETKAVTDALSIDVTGGEQDWDLATWERMIEMRAVDVVQPDVMYMGGLLRTLEVARLAASGGPSLYAAQRQSVAGHDLHHALAGRA